MPKSDNGDERSQNVYPQYVRIATQNNPTALREQIALAKAAGPLNENHLRIALQNASKKGNEQSARILLETGAKTDLTGKKGSPALFWAVSQPQTRGHTKVVSLLLQGNYEGCPADTEWADEHGSTISMSAASRGHKEALSILLESGANVNAIDKEGRTILHTLAAEKKPIADKKPKWDQAVVSLILDKSIDLDIRDSRHRTALHWACATGKRELVEQILSRRKHKRGNINTTTSRGKTALHLACDAFPADAMVVELLLKHGADPSIRSDGGFTCLHNSASVQSSVEIVNMILEYCPQLINAQTSPGLTPLHFAAQSGSLEVVECLLSKPETKINAKDSFYSTPLLRAAQFNHLNVVNRLAPFNNFNRLSPYAVRACTAFAATIVDFRYGGEHQNLVQKRTVFEVLYGLDTNGDPTVTTQVQKIKSKSKPGPKSGGNADSSGPRFRWIHLPANNMAWVEALIAKSFVESGASDVDGFKAVEKGFSQQHRGPQFHSHFMRPLCLRSPRGTDSGEKLPTYGMVESALRASASHAAGRGDIASSPERTGRRRMPILQSSADTQATSRYDKFSPLLEQAEVADDSRAAQSFGPLNNMAMRRNTGVDSSSPRTPRLLESSPARDTSSPPETVNTGGKRVRPRRRRKNDEPSEAPEPVILTPASRKPSIPVSDHSAKSSGSNNKSTAQAGSNVTFFMPYLHFETDERRRMMRDAVTQAEAQLSGTTGRPKSDDETLVWAHLHSTTGLHMRRTLDQFYLHGIDTEHRDSDQVVGRYCRDKGKEEKIFMVDQLWLWILGPGLIVTSFPQRWQQPKNDPLNVLDGVIEDLNSKTRPQVQSVYDLALLITARCSGSFDRHRPGDEDFQFLDMFESSIGHVSNQEAALYNDFYKASAAVHEWLSSDRTTSKDLTYYGQTHDQYPAVVDHFINIGKETKLLQEIKDIREELNMISLVLSQQKSTLPALCDAVCEDLTKAYNHSKVRESKRKIEEQKKIVSVHLEELARMGKLAGSIEESLLNLLDLKQKQSNALEARFARDQAAGTVRQGQIIMVFTMVTIIFLPLSFMASFFAINIQEFPHDAEGHLALNLGYVTKYTLGIGLGISVLLIAIAFGLNRLSTFGRGVRDALAMRRSHKPSLPATSSKAAEIYGLNRALADRKSTDTGKSMEFEALPRAYTGFSQASRRYGYSQDLERAGGDT